MIMLILGCLSNLSSSCQDAKSWILESSCILLLEVLAFLVWIFFSPVEYSKYLWCPIGLRLFDFSWLIHLICFKLQGCYYLPIKKEIRKKNSCQSYMLYPQICVF